MPKNVIVVPKIGRLDNCINFVNELREIQDFSEGIVFDFQRVDWMQPFTMLFLSSEIQRFCADKTATIACQNFTHLTYPGHMGFFKAFNADFGKNPGEALGGPSYVPINIFSCEDLRKKASENRVHVGEIVENQSNELAAILVQDRKGVLYDTLKFAIREIIRNVVEHGESNQFGFCAQYWRAKGEVEVAILDRGVGVRKSLSQNPNLSIQSDYEALNLALMPGVSGKSYGGRKNLADGFWGNSGFGLYMTNRLCRNGGNFFIVSGGAGIYLEGERKVPVDTAFRGTAIRLFLRLNGLSDLQKSLVKFKIEGHEYAQRWRNGESITASTASQVLRSDFQE